MLLMPAITELTMDRLRLLADGSRRLGKWDLGSGYSSQAWSTPICLRRGLSPRSWGCRKMPNIILQQMLRKVKYADNYSSLAFCLTFLSTLGSPSWARGARSAGGVTSPLGATTKGGSGDCLLAVSILSSS